MSRSSCTSHIWSSNFKSFFSALSSKYCSCSACKLAATCNASVHSWSRSRSAYASDAANLACVSLICLSFSPIIQRWRPLSSSSLASSVVSRVICAVSTPSAPPPPKEKNPESLTRRRAASPSSTSSRARRRLISSAALISSARFTPSSVSRMRATFSEDVSSSPSMPLKPAFSARMASRSSACAATMDSKAASSYHLMRSADCAATLTYVGFMVRCVSMGIHFEAYCAAWNSATVSVALFARLPTSSSASCPTDPNASVTWLTWLANARRSREPLTKSALLSRSSPCSRSATASSFERTRAAISLDSADCAGEDCCDAKRGTSPCTPPRDFTGGGVACDRTFCAFALEYLSSGSNAPPGRRLIAPREKERGREPSRSLPSVSRTKSRAAGLCACAADSGSARVFSRANRRDAAPVARGRQVSSEIRRERIGRRPVSTANHLDTSVRAHSSAQRRHDGCHRVEPPRHSRDRGDATRAPNVPRRRRRSRRVRLVLGRAGAFFRQALRETRRGGWRRRAPRARVPPFSRAPRARARPHLGGTFSARLCLEPAAPRHPRRAESPTRAIVIRRDRHPRCAFRARAE